MIEILGVVLLIVIMLLMREIAQLREKLHKTGQNLRYFEQAFYEANAKFHDYLIREGKIVTMRNGVIYQIKDKPNVDN